MGFMRVVENIRFGNGSERVMAFSRVTGVPARVMRQAHTRLSVVVTFEVQ